MATKALSLLKSSTYLSASEGAEKLVATIENLAHRIQARVLRLGRYLSLYAQQEPESEPEKEIFFQQRIEAFLDMYFEDFEPLRKCIKGAAGLGKSTAIMQQLKNFQGVAWYLVPTIKMAREVHQALQNSGVTSSAIYEGRGESNCQRFSFIQRYLSAITSSKSLAETFCKAGEENECFNYNNCPYIDGLAKASHATILVGAHQLLLQSPDLPKPDWIIVDESCWQIMAKKDKLLISSLIDLSLEKSKEADAYRKVVRDVEDALRDTPKTYLKTLRDLGYETRDDFASVFDYLHELETDQLKIEPKFSNVRIARVLESAESNPRARNRAIKLFEFLACELAIGRNIGHGLTYKGGTINMHQLASLNPMIKQWVPILFLDASADPLINCQIWGEALETIDIPVPRQAYFHQVYGRTFSRQSITGLDAFGGALRPDIAEKLRKEIISFVNSFEGDIFVAASKQVLEILKPHFKATVRTAHFANMRGTNDFKDCSTAIIIGREEPSALAMEAHARALWSSASEPLNLTGQYGKAPYQIKPVNGDSQIIMVNMHADPRVQALLAQVREGEASQALDRLRLVHNSKPKNVFMLNGLYIDGIQPHHLYRWFELIAGGNKLEQALKAISRQALAFPLSPSELSRLFPELWHSRDAAKSYIDRHGGRKWVETQIRNYYLQNDPFILAAYRRRGQRRASRAILSSNLFDPRAALESVIGPVVSFKIIPN